MTDYQRSRFRHALLGSLAQGEALALVIHDRMRDRGFDRDELPHVWAELRVLEAEGLASSTRVPSLSESTPRRRFAITRRGVAAYATKVPG